MPLIRQGNNPTPPSDPPAGKDVLAALHSGTKWERWDAARAAVAVPHGAMALGQALFRETDTRVREAIFTSLMRIGSSESVQALLPHLRADDAGIRTGALDALRAMPQQVALHVPNLLLDSDPDIRILACDLTLVLPAAEGAPLLGRLLETERQANVCGAAVNALAEIGGADALPILAQCAERFRDDPFLSFSVKVAGDRLRALPRERLG
jgi:HEAT repeat protein